MRLNVFYTINDGFVPQLGAAVCSVCENNRAAEEIVFYIGAMEVSEEHRAQLKALAEGYGRTMWSRSNTCRSGLGLTSTRWAGARSWSPGC